MGSAELGIFGGPGSAALPPIERQHPTPEDESQVVEQEQVVIEHIKPAFEGEQVGPREVRNLAAAAPWGQGRSLAVREFTVVPQPQPEALLEEALPPKRGYRYNASYELQDLDLERMDIREKLEEAKAAITELEGELASANFAQRAILSARTLRHRKATENLIVELEQKLRGNENRRTALIQRRERERRAREDARQLAGHETWDMGDEAQEDWYNSAAV